MSIASIPTSYVPTQRPHALQANAQRLQQRVQAQASPLKPNGLPKSPLSPLGTSRAGKTMSHSVGKRLLNLHM
jgi:hypothetical protein